MKIIRDRFHSGSKTFDQGVRAGSLHSLYVVGVCINWIGPFRSDLGNVSDRFGKNEGFVIGMAR